MAEGRRRKGDMTLTHKWISLKGGSMLRWKPGKVIYGTAVRDLESLRFETKLSGLLQDR